MGLARIEWLVLSHACQPGRSASWMVSPMLNQAWCPRSCSVQGTAARTHVCLTNTEFLIVLPFRQLLHTYPGMMSGVYLITTAIHLAQILAASGAVSGTLLVSCRSDLAR